MCVGHKVRDTNHGTQGHSLGGDCPGAVQKSSDRRIWGSGIGRVDLCWTGAHACMP
jgi:hypothetical protein